MSELRVRVYVGRIPTADAFEHMTETLSKIVQTPEERRRAKNRRYYERHREVWHWYGQIRKLRRLRDLLCGPKLGALN